MLYMNMNIGYFILIFNGVLGCARTLGVQSNVILKEDTWKTTLAIKIFRDSYQRQCCREIAIFRDFNQAQCCQELRYYLYVVPIYPKGNIQTWSVEYLKTKENKWQYMHSALKDSRNVEKSGILLHSETFETTEILFTVANRWMIDYMLVILARDKDGTEFKYEPVHIKGCLSRNEREDKCKIFEPEYPMNLVLCFTIMFWLLSLKFDIIHVLFCGWITIGIFTLTIWNIVRPDQILKDSTLYIICLGIAPACAITITILCRFKTKRHSRFRMFFTASLITMILLSIMWFTQLRLYKFKNRTLFISVSVTVASVLQFVLLWCNYLTMTIGSSFITSVLISLACSLNYLNGSIIPFIFVDFYNSIVYPSFDWIYYSPMLVEDLIIIILCPILSILGGLVFYCRLERPKAKTNEPMEPPNEIICRNGDFQLNPINVVEHAPLIPQPTSLHDPPPQYIHLPTSTSKPIIDEPPPSYDSCVKMKTIPTAPVSYAANP